MEVSIKMNRFLLMHLEWALPPCVNKKQLKRLTSLKNLSFKYAEFIFDLYNPFYLAILNINWFRLRYTGLADMLKLACV
jgi:hypothetical protein